MNYLLFVAFLALMALSGTYLVLRVTTRVDRRAACLRSIDRLERELFPEWFKDEPPAFGFGPGEVWSVEPGAKAYYYLPPPKDSQAGAAMALRRQQELVLLYGEKRT